MVLMDSVGERLPVLLYAGEDGWIVAECPLIPGCVSQGRDRAEALQQIQEAIALCLEARREEGWRLPDRYEVLDVPIGG